MSHRHVFVVACLLATFGLTAPSADASDGGPTDAGRAERLAAFWGVAPAPAPPAPQISPPVPTPTAGSQPPTLDAERAAAAQTRRDVAARRTQPASTDEVGEGRASDDITSVAPSRRTASAAGRERTAVAPMPAGGDPTGVVAAARRYLGVPYVYGGTNPAVGLDCSAFVQRAFADVGVSLPRVVAGQKRVGVEVPSLDLAEPGDLIVWCRAFGGSVNCLGAAGHIGIYLGGGQVIHAGNPVHEAPVSSIRTRDPIVTIRRVL